ncbi:MAG: hypothetical protein CMJ77_25160 [Planctomycetaceae bacterium]|nr:hypothetical protein [Planctomycetaceae bacterium]
MHAGESAKCPECDAITVIPDASVAGGESRSDDGFHISDGNNPFSDAEDSVQRDRNPFEAPKAGIDPQKGDGMSGAILQQHRGVFILVLGIMSLICCHPLGIAPWVMANEDLARMDRGQMDSSGRGLTQAGKVCSIIALGLIALRIVQFVLVLVEI